MKYELFISDYDGTLGLAPKNDIDDETLSAIKKFTKKGGKFVVCSGRETTSITRILKKHGLTGLVVSFQGARITDIESGKSIIDGGLDLNTALKVLNDVKENGLVPIAYGDSEIYVNEMIDRVEYYRKAVGLDCFVLDVEQYLKQRKDGIFKICGVGDDKLVNQVADKLNAIYKGVGVKFNSGAKGLLEAINPAYDKGEAVKFLSRYFSVPFEKILTVGDSTNDIDLVKGKWFGVAVGDGRDEVKAVAKEITVPFNERPVKHLLDKYCLND